MGSRRIEESDRCGVYSKPALLQLRPTSPLRRRTKQKPRRSGALSNQVAELMGANMLRFRTRRRDSDVVALHVVIAGDHFGCGPFQRFALLALALGFVDGIDERLVDAARG